jgi:lipid II:glycine glycyltransferase (peptidoglycan interpeptide bridge formation enzyme)
MTNKQQYSEFCKKEKDIPVFSQPWWLDAVCGEKNWDVALVEKGGQIWGSMPYLKIKKYIFNMSGPPKLTQTLGPYIKYPPKQKYYKKLSWEKELMLSLINQQPKSDYFHQNFHYSVKNWLPFYWQGFQQTTRYTYVIENISIQNLEGNLETDIRRRRKKAEKLGVKVFDLTDINQFYDVNVKTFLRKKMAVPYTLNFVKILYETCLKNNACKMYAAKDINGQIIAANFLLFDNNTVYYLMGGIDPDYKDVGGMDMVIFESIKFALQSNRKFDFEGSMIESVEKYFRSFGAKQMPYYSVSKVNSRLLSLYKAIRVYI